MSGTTRAFLACLALTLSLWPSFGLTEETAERRFRANQVFAYPGPVLFRSHFAGLGFDKLSLSEDGRYNLPVPTPGRIDLVPAPGLADDGKAVRFTVPRLADSYRAEISLPYEKGWRERWYGERLLIPADWVIDPGRAADIVMQWHAIPGNGKPTHPNLAIAVQDKSWWIRQHFGDPHTQAQHKSVRLDAPLEPGKWVDWVIHARWAPGPEGLVEIWKDGQQVATLAGANVYGTIGAEYTPYLKTGIYHPEWHLDSPRKQEAFAKEQPASTRKVVLVAAIAVGSEKACFKDVAP